MVTYVTSGGALHRGVTASGGSISSAIATIDATSIKRSQRLEEVMHYLRSKHVPSRLRFEVGARHLVVLVRHIFRQNDSTSRRIGRLPTQRHRLGRHRPRYG